jgi:hypothetical protein
VLAAAAASFCAALVHGSVIAAHLREWWLFGLFFIIVTPLQVLWSVLAVRRPHDRRLLLAGAAGNLAIVLVWLVSRLVGLPFGPETFRPEAIGVKDLLATYDELAVVLLVGLLLAGRPVRAWGLGAVWVIAGVSFAAAFIAGH